MAPASRIEHLAPDQRNGKPSAVLWEQNLAVSSARSEPIPNVIELGPNEP
jgi:hypothetical protein